MVLERTSILSALRQAHGNIGKAARALGASRRTLQNRMREYGMARGRSGRPKRRLPYGRHGARAAQLVGALALVGGALYLGRRRSA